MTDRNEEQSPGAALGGALAVIGTGTKTIVVNGREHVFAGEEIGRGELVRLAFPAIGMSNEGALTIAYDNGPEGARHGLLGSGRTTRVLDGQTFSVALCDKS